MKIAIGSDHRGFESKELVKALKMNGADVTYCEISSGYGHDAFLLEFDEQTRLIGPFLARTLKKITKKKRG